MICYLLTLLGKFNIRLFSLKLIKILNMIYNIKWRSNPIRIVTRNYDEIGVFTIPDTSLPPHSNNIPSECALAVDYLFWKHNEMQLNTNLIFEVIKEERKASWLASKLTSEPKVGHHQDWASASGMAFELCPKPMHLIMPSSLYLINSICYSPQNG